MTSPLRVLPEEPARVQKPPVEPDTLVHRDLLDGPFWQKIPAYREVNEATFLDSNWQAKNTITNVQKLLKALEGLVTPDFIADAEAGFKKAPMSVRVSPYLLSLIEWQSPYEDPLRIQFVPLRSRLLPDHPKLNLDSLNEQGDAPVAGLTHRYPDKALFLPLDTCPVYCRFCTRSYAVGVDTEEVEKVSLNVNEARWRQAYEYIASRPELEDIVISGGDAYQLRAQQITDIGEALLAMPNVRRMRFATKGPAVMPMKILTDDAWTDALTRIVEKGRALHKEVVLHTHFNHPREITSITERAMNKLMERGVFVRNQSVLQHRVNDTPEVMGLLVKRLGHVNVHPYYVYVHDLVKGVEDLRTTLDTALYLEKYVRGATAGFNTPTFVVDAPGGGGKRDAHSYEYYDRETGISVFTAPAVKPGQYFVYYDPLHRLSESAQRRWAEPHEHETMINLAIQRAKERALSWQTHFEIRDIALRDAFLRLDANAIARRFGPVVRTCESLENRVFLLPDRLVKVYRPERWSREALDEELCFLSDLRDAGVPVAIAKETGEHEGMLYAAFERIDGTHLPERPDDALLMEMGRLLARMHDVGEKRPTLHRLTFEPQGFGLGTLEVMRPFAPTDYVALAEKIIRECAPLYRDVPMLRIHGDFYEENCMRTPAGLVPLDFDDLVMGYAVHDVWIATRTPPADSDQAESARRRSVLLRGYREIRAFDDAWLTLIPSMRAMRRVWFNAWIGSRQFDPLFQKAFSDFGTKEFWERELSRLQATT